MPRTKAQPTWMSMMIKNRIIAAQKRLDLAPNLEESLDQMRHERSFESALRLPPAGDNWGTLGA